MVYTLQQIIQISNCEVIGNRDLQLNIDTLLTDSRSLTTAQSTMFFAFRTKHGNGSKYIPELYKKGVRVFVLDDPDDINPSSMPQAVFLTGNPLQTLQTIATYHRAQYSDLTTIAITGSNGKTIVKEWLYQLIGDQQSTIRSPKSYNSQIGVPLSVMLINEKTQLAIIEAGISQPGEMQHLQQIIDPKVVILTNIGSAHQENFIDLAQKTTEKLQLAKNSDILIYPADDKGVCEAIQLSGSHIHTTYGWSTIDPDAPLYICSIRTEGNNSIITYKLTDGSCGTYTIPFISQAAIDNSITCMATAIALGYNHEFIASRMSLLEPVAMRLEVKEGQRGLILINDTYNSDVNSLAIALDFMGRRMHQSSQESVLILSDILQSGQSKTDLYCKVAQMIDQQHISRIITVGPETAVLPSEHFDSTDQLINSHILDSLHDSTVLIKGSRDYQFDRITSLLEKRVHETILEVNLNAIVDNLNHYRSLMKPHEKIVCMVKASAYGSGSIEVSKTLQDHNVDYLAVAVADEGVALRQGGINGHIMIMNPEMTAFHDLFQYNLEPEVYNFKILNALIQAAKREGITDFPVHIKLDTGMHRLGFNPSNDIEPLIHLLQHQDAVKPISVFSHFVGSDGDCFDDFTRGQFAIFNDASSKLKQAFPTILRHICNSAGIERFPEYHLDMVRLGIGLYGINPFDNSVINTISTLKTTILQIRDVVATDTVGYSRWGKLTRPSRIAAIPIGYADGLNRHLGRGVGYCLVNGQKAPYVGNICMDVCMIDVTDIDCREGDSVEIFGNNLPVTVLSDLLDTIPYEILTSVSERVKRVYFS